jgi:TonB family protein
MQKEHSISTVFDRWGNLRMEAMERYLRGELNPEELVLFKARLAESEFDREALEGFSKQKDESARSDVFDLEERILLTGREKRPSAFSPARRRYYLAAAASLVAVVTVTAILIFQFRQSVQQPELAAMARDTIQEQPVGVVVPAPKDQTVIPKEITQQVLHEATVVKETISEELDQESPVSEMLEDNVEVAPDILPQEEITMPQMMITEVEANAGQEVELDAAKAVAAEPMDKTVGGVSVQSSNAGYRSMDKSDRKAAAESEMPEADTTDEVIFTDVDQWPSYPGGDTAMINFFKRNLQYPEMAKANNIEGRVFVRFVVEKDGTVSNVAVLRGIGGGCDEEALRVVKLMQWNPGRQNGSALRVQYTLPILFSLAGK